MSHFLDEAAKQDPQRRADLEANDEAERARDQADLDYLRNQQQREQRRLQETIELERGYHQRMGWIL